MFKPLTSLSPLLFTTWQFINIIQYNPFLNFKRGIFIFRIPEIHYYLRYVRNYFNTPYLPIPDSSFINNCVWLYGLKKKFYVELEYWFDSRRLKPRHYPACVSACNIEDNYHCIAVDYSGKHTGPDNFHPSLMHRFENELKAVPYNKSSKTTVKHKVGNCAEQNVANDMLIAYNCSPDYLNFSFALRPRTMTVMDPCDNCKKIFPIAPRI